MNWSTFKWLNEMICFRKLQLWEIQCPSCIHFFRNQQSVNEPSENGVIGPMGKRYPRESIRFSCEGVHCRRFCADERRREYDISMYLKIFVFFDELEQKVFSMFCLGSCPLLVTFVNDDLEPLSRENCEQLGLQLESPRQLFNVWPLTSNLADISQWIEVLTPNIGKIKIWWGEIILNSALEGPVHRDIPLTDVRSIHLPSLLCSGGGGDFFNCCINKTL